MTEFKQIIGRGTRVRDDYGKLWFNIIDYTGSATRMFADPAFDDEPTRITEEQITPEGEPTGEEQVIADQWPDEQAEGEVVEPPEAERRKFYYDGGQVEIVAHIVHELDPDGNQLRVIRYTDYAAEKVRTLFPTVLELRSAWGNPDKRSEIIRSLQERGISFEELAEAAKQPEADPFDLLCHLAYNAPLRTRRERAQQLRRTRPDFFQRFGPEARQILDELLEKYADHGDAQFVLPDVLKVPPLSAHGQISDIIRLFGGAEQLRAAVNELQSHLYAA